MIKKLFRIRFVRYCIISILIVIIGKGAFCASLLFIPLPVGLTSDFSTAYYYSDDSIAWISLNDNSQYRINTDLDMISAYLCKGILAYEDKYFYVHPGFNPVSIIRAFILNNKYGRIISGGSTITMQLARLAEPKQRTLMNKIYELFRALQIEARYSKKEILRLYLNSIPMGGNIQGVGTAAFFYFNKNPDALSFLECALLIGISNNPETFRPDRNYEHSQVKRDVVAKRIHKRFAIEAPELDKMIKVPTPVNRGFFMYDVIPLVERMKKLPFKNRRKFALDKKKQALSLGILTTELEALNCMNGAVIIVDNRTMEVVTYIGSPYYNRQGNGVKYNACNILRSPGSTLKPFIYGRAIEKGLISQKTILYDFPEEFYGYKPKNYSNKYMGLIAADQALIRSLNIPAVFLASGLRGQGVKRILSLAGYRNRAKHIGNEDLSVALGSYPLSLENMVELYAALANNGTFRNLTFFSGNTPGQHTGTHILKPGTTYILSEILSRVSRPDLPASWEFTGDKPRVAFKTGTSYGFVDAWSIGYTPRYTIGVWIGNLDNKFTRVLTGITAASPVLFKIINELERVNDDWFVQPESVKTRKVCAVSGLTPNNYCSNVQEELYLPGNSLNKFCTVHKKVFIDQQSGEVTAVEDLDVAGRYNEVVLELWDEKTEYYLKKLGKKTTASALGNYTDIYNKNRLVIESPLAHVHYVVYLNENVNNQKIPLIAYEYPDSKQFYWYANERFLGSTATHTPLHYLPEDKQVTISVVDEVGRSSSVDIQVEYVR